MWAKPEEERRGSEEVWTEQRKDGEREGDRWISKNREVCRQGFRNLRQTRHENERGELDYMWKSEATERQRRERQMEKTKVGRDRDNSVRVYRVYVLNTLQETEHTLRDDSESR